MVTTILAMTLTLARAGAPDGALSAGAAAVRDHDVSIVVWTDRREVFRRGDRVRVYFRAATDGYVTIFRVDTDGRVRVLYPHHPWDDNYVRAGRRYEVRDPYGRHGSRAFVVEDYPGQGYLFAVVSLDPFDYRHYVRHDRWDHRVIGHGGRIAGDPYLALGELIDRIVPLGYDAYGYDVHVYHVERRYDYPRFLCYDCHGYVAYARWDPYREWCATFRVVIYDPHPVRVYPYAVHVYAPTAVVYRRTVRLAPQFVVRERRPGEAPVVRERRPAPEREWQPRGRDDDDAVRPRPRVPVRRPRTTGAPPAATPRETGGAVAPPAPRRTLPAVQAPRRREVAEPPTGTPVDRPRLERRDVAPAPQVEREHKPAEPRRRKTDEH